MNHAHHPQHAHHSTPVATSIRSLDRIALSATLHCLFGCALGEVAGMVIGNILGLGNGRDRAAGARAGLPFRLCVHHVVRY